jgi:hypothetical protein
LDDLDHIAGVLSTTTLPIGTPAPHLAVPMITNVDPELSQQP